MCVVKYLHFECECVGGAAETLSTATQRTRTARGEDEEDDEDEDEEKGGAFGLKVPFLPSLLRVNLNSPAN